MLRDLNSPASAKFTDFWAQCRYYFYTWIPRVYSPCAKLVLSWNITYSPEAAISDGILEIIT